MLLENKIAVVYGAGGHIGSSVARAFAREGARVFLAGRTLGPLDKVAGAISAEGGKATIAPADALDEQSVAKHVADVMGAAGRIDISFNAVGWQDVQGAPLLEMSMEDFERPIEIATRTQLVVAKAVAPRMIAHGPA